jgi:putative SOS response-associated peptidase YedK
MCSHYHGLQQREHYRRHFGVEPPAELGRHDLWPGYAGVFIRRRPDGEAGAEVAAPAEAVNGLFGLVPHWSPDTTITRFTYNARSESVGRKPSFRDAWRRAQHCIIAAETFFEPDWRSGRAVPTCIRRQDGAPMGFAGLWSSWTSPKGDLVLSYTLLTIPAADHPLLRLMHKPSDEKRMVVILPDDAYGPWLTASAGQSQGFMRAFPADQLRASVPGGHLS